MILIPQSIQAPNTIAIDETFAERLKSIGVNQLLIDLTNERDIKKLSLYLQQFGIPIELLPNKMNDLQFRSLLQNVLHIYRLSGTIKSISMLASAIGATKIEIIKNAFILCHNRQSYHNRSYQHNKGKNYKHFAISMKIQGIPTSLQPSFTSTLTQLFYLFEPINIYLESITHI
ncbi:MAG: hypothetical protein RR277_04985 [Rikenellaceae bacterium]